MEGDLPSCLQYEEDIDDSKYLCGLSTILVANIQELKDRISQIEFIFCSQLFPSFQSRSKSFQKRLLEARKSAEGDWKTKESLLLSQIEELRLEKQHAQEQIHQLHISLEQSKTRLMSSEQLLNREECEKKQLLDKVESLERQEEAIAELKEQLAQKTGEVAKEKELQERLLQQIELKDQQILTERRKGRCVLEDMSTRYKNLKSQYTFILRKSCIVEEKQHFSDRMEEDNGSRPPYMNKRTLHGNKDQETTELSLEPKELRYEKALKLKDVEDTGFVKTSSGGCSRINQFPPKHTGNTTKPEKPSCWRVTRMRQEPGGADPHDDFLDTPMEAIRNSNKGSHEEVQDAPVPSLDDMEFNNSDDETQDVNAEALRQQQPHVSAAPRPEESKGFKYVEPVRKKAERENLKGVECKQCKKFYDAALPDGGQGNGGDGSKSMRCEHHDGISRHRYRYVPPSTPEGFWNIGFDSDI